MYGKLTQKDYFMIYYDYQVNRIRALELVDKYGISECHTHRVINRGREKWDDDPEEFERMCRLFLPK